MHGADGPADAETKSPHEQDCGADRTSLREGQTEGTCDCVFVLRLREHNQLRSRTRSDAISADRQARIRAPRGARIGKGVDRRDGCAAHGYFAAASMVARTGAAGTGLPFVG